METNKMESLYQVAATTLNEMIPEEWDKILLYSEVREGFSQVFFYYYPINEDSPVYSLDILDNFNIDPQYFKQLKQELYGAFEELWNEFKIQNQEQWTNLTFLLENTGQMKIEYGYEDVADLNHVEKQEQWEKRYINGNGFEEI
ncbi:immunity protein YezG family protein [Alkalihalobacillus sp. TS-13]|uniref:immunity protein YezG family protein n=1 Tax=Alkalihalobacillus sp. TS-13 TaxID=2842455 RepID=UPI001C869A58|nr:immunity protein YezG family protein [Alkalihalobacillus sp. TS-13]